MYLFRRAEHLNDFVAASRDLERQIRSRAKELYPHYDEMWSETAIGYEGGAFCQEDAMKEAQESLEAGLTADEWKARKEASRCVMRTVYLSHAEDEAIRVEAFRSGRTKNDVMVELIRNALENK